MDLIVTDLGVIEVTPDGLVLREVASGVTPEEVEKATEPMLQRARGFEDDVRVDARSKVIYCVAELRRELRFAIPCRERGLSEES